MSHGVCIKCRDVHARAQRAAKRAVRQGILIKPEACSKCGHKPLWDRDIHGHHPSYDEDKWLDVVWLCRSCHDWAHRQPGAPNCIWSVKNPPDFRTHRPAPRIYFSDMESA